MNLRFSFSWVGLAVFALPMLINIAYVIFPPVGAANEPAAIPRPLEITERVSRIVYLIAVTFLVSGEPVSRRSAALYIAACFLILYYAVWIRYFAGGRNVALLGKAFWFVPMPLAVFPVLYFLFAAVWLRNIPAAVTAVIFGAAHIAVSVRSFR